MSLAELRAAYAADPTLATWRALREGLAEELRALVGTAEARAEGQRDFTSEEEARFLELETEHTSLAADEDSLQRAENVRASRARWGTTQVAPARPDEQRDLRSMNRSELRDAGMRLLDDEARTSHMRDIQIPVSMDSDGQYVTDSLDVARAKEHIGRLLRTNNRNFSGEAFSRWMLATESEEYRSAFAKVVSGGQVFLTEAEGRALQLVNELRATMNITTDAQGGFGIPVLIDPTIILTGQGTPNPFYDIARVENISTDEWKGITSAGATSYWTTEGVTMTDGGPTLAQPTITTKKLTTLVKYTFEFQGDYPNWASEMAGIMAASREEALVQAFTQGLGTSAQPTGIVTALEANAATSKVMVATDGSIFPADFYALWEALPVRYRGSSTWMWSTSVENRIRGFSVGSSAADANFTVNLTQSAIPNLFGRPIRANDYMDSAVGSGGSTSASDITPAILGDFRNFLIANRVGATIETVQHLIDTTSGLPNGTRGTFMWSRVGSGVTNPNGFRYLHQS
jgi:HK97 family phage major capsid protein